MYKWTLAAVLLPFCLCVVVMELLDATLPVPVSALFWLAILLAQIDFATKGRLTAPCLALFGLHVRPSPATRREIGERSFFCVIVPLVPGMFIMYLLVLTLALSPLNELETRIAASIARGGALLQGMVFGMAQGFWMQRPVSPPARSH